MSGDPDRFTGDEAEGNAWVDAMTKAAPEDEGGGDDEGPANAGDPAEEAAAV